ncbi:hypothetical protein [Terasakiella sp.]|uniref:hypothetical protein n=1 Tax=Terasakiella sp. TaxID=2034861 RepID=UPI003AA96C77
MTLRNAVFFLGLLCLTFASTVAQAAQTEIKSCYELIGIGDTPPPVQKRELVIAVDQTVEFDKSIQEHAFKKIQHFLRPGDSVKLVSFSAYVQGNFTNVVLKGLLDTRLSDDERYDIPKKVLKKIDHCYALQDRAVREGIGKALLTTFANSSSKIPNTELLDNLNLISKSLYSEDITGERYLLIISDMMEHSTLTSFYKSGSLRKLSPETELAKIKKAGLEMNFKQANVYVIGAGYSKSGKYQSGEGMRNFQSFWTDFFFQGNGSMKAFGTPLLIGEIK